MTIDVTDFPRAETFVSIDLVNADVVGIQVSSDGNRLWLCVNGACVLRVKNIKRIDIDDARKESING